MRRRLLSPISPFDVVPPHVVEAAKRIGADARALQFDVTNRASIAAAAQRIRNELGRLDVLVNNAGVYEFAPLENVTVAHFHKQFDVNVLGLLLATREASKYLNGDGGSIINISSVVGIHPLPGGAVYSATKAAVDAVTKSLARELGPRKIRVNSINPGMIETEGLHAAGFAEGDFRKQVEATTPLGRIGQPQDIATVATFLASSDSGWITGETFIVSGGNRP